MGNTHATSTIRIAASAIAHYHRVNGHTSPTDHQGVKAVLSGVQRLGKPPVQAKGLTAKDWNAIQKSSRITDNTHLFELCLVGLMRDCLLRRSEVQGLNWDDLWEEEGAGRLLVARSKTDQEGKGHIGYVSATVMGYLELMRGEGRIFDISTRHINRRIQRACQRAGLEDNYSGHSPRIGMAMDLARTTTLTALTQAGRWKKPDMPIHYVRSITAGQGAVAEYYKKGNKK